VAVFAADMNLRAVIRKARNGKLGGAGGYLAHIGVGIMLAGVVISSDYARTRSVTLPINEPTKIGNSTLTFLRVVPGTATRKQAMEVRVRTAGGKTYYAYPKMYVNSRTNQLMANPSIRNTPLADFYMAPQEYDPGRPEIVGRDVSLRRGTTTNIEGTGVTFRDFQADRAAMMRGERDVLILTDVTITPPDGAKHDTTLRYVYHLDGGPPESPELEVPGVAGAFMRVVSVSPNDGAVIVRLRGMSKDPRQEFQAATKESLSVQITHKPLISLVWAGFYVLMAGAFLALVKRAREARKAVVLPREAPAPSEVVMPTGPALPAHSRSPAEPIG
jgi:cytochrome c-type biogenesis protein CcmF